MIIRKTKCLNISGHFISIDKKTKKSIIQFDFNLLKLTRFIKYETARRIKEEEEIKSRGYKFNNNAAAKSLQHISKKSVGKRGLSRTSFGIPQRFQYINLFFFTKGGLNLTNTLYKKA